MRCSIRYAVVLAITVWAINLWLGWRLDQSHPVPKYDEAVYADLAREYARSGAPMRRLGEPPRLYVIHPYLQSLVWSAVFRPATTTSQSVTDGLTGIHKMRWLVSLSAGMVLLLLAISLSTRTKYPGGMAILGCLSITLLALNPQWCAFQHLAYLEVPVALPIQASLVLLAGALWSGQHSGKLLFFSGGLAGAAMITKYTALPWFPAALIGWRWLSQNQSGEQPRWRGGLVWIAGALLVFLSWPLLIWWWGELGDWIGMSLGRWTSFRAGKGGDPRTDWGIVKLVVETSRQLGLVHTGLLGSGLTLSVMTFFGTIWSGRGKKESGLGSPVMILLRLHELFASVFLLVWIISPTRDPKFLVTVLPSLCVVASAGYQSFANRFLLHSRWNSRFGRVGILMAALVLLVIGFPMDLFGLDQTALRLVYPSENAYNQACLPHGREYLAPSQFLAENTPSPKQAVVVGRQGPIVGYLADRPYHLLYTQDKAESILRLLESHQYLVIDDAWRWCLAGLPKEDQAQVKNWIVQSYRVVMEKGRLRLYEKDPSSGNGSEEMNH